MPWSRRGRHAAEQPAVVGVVDGLLVLADLRDAERALAQADRRREADRAGTGGHQEIGAALFEQRHLRQHHRRAQRAAGPRRELAERAELGDAHPLHLGELTAERLVDAEAVDRDRELPAADVDRAGAYREDLAAVNPIRALDHLTEIELHDRAGLRSARKQAQHGRNDEPPEAVATHMLSFQTNGPATHVAVVTGGVTTGGQT